MKRERSDRAPSQAMFNFDSAPSAQSERAVELLTKTVSPASASVVRMVEHQRSRHLDTVKQLLAETGVFRVR